MILVDNFSRMTWVVFLKDKYEAFDKVKIFKNRVENESGMKIKCLRSNKEGEFTSISLIFFVKKMESKDSYHLQEPLNRMTLQREGIG